MARLYVFQTRSCRHRWMLVKLGLQCRSCGRYRVRRPQVVPFPGAA